VTGKVAQFDYLPALPEGQAGATGSTG
jgi:hypothetical protein